MKYINVAYDYEYDDDGFLIDIGLVDILLVPDFVCDNLDKITQKFHYWVGDEVYYGDKNNYNEYWTQLDGQRVMCVGTDHFVKWLNDNYFCCENQESVIVKVETAYNPNYPIAKF